MTQKDGLDAIIEKKLSRAEILQLRQDGQLPEAEFLLLFSLDNEVFFRKILKGVGEYRLPFDSTVPTGACFTNVPLLMHAFYSLYGKYPLYHFDRLFAFGLTSLLSTRFDLPEALYLLHDHLQREEDGTASFSIPAAPLLEKAAVYLRDENYRRNLAKDREYDASLYEEGSLGLFRDYNELFLRRGGVSILPDEAGSEKPPRPLPRKSKPKEQKKDAEEKRSRAQEPAPAVQEPAPAVQEPAPAVQEPEPAPAQTVSAPRMLFVSFAQEEPVKGRLSVYVNREKVCTLENREAFAGAPLAPGRNIIRAIYGPDLWLLPFLRRTVKNTEHALGAWVAKKWVLPAEGGDRELSFRFVKPSLGVSGKAVFDLQEIRPRTATAQEKKRPAGAAASGGERLPPAAASVFSTDTGRDLVTQIFPPTPSHPDPFNPKWNTYRLLGYVSCDRSVLSSGREYRWEYLCEASAWEETLLIRESYFTADRDSTLSDIDRSCLRRIESESLTAAKAETLRQNMLPADGRTVHMPLSLEPAYREEQFFRELFRFSHRAGKSAPQADHRWPVEVWKSDIHPADTCGPCGYELDDRMTVSELLRFISRRTLLCYGAWDWDIYSKGEHLGSIETNAGEVIDPGCEDRSLREKDIRSVGCVNR